MKNNTILEKEVRTFLSDFCSIPEKKININSDIVHDLKIEGDDAAELMDSFSKRFIVNLSTFDLSEYFVSESAFNPIRALCLLFYGKKKKLKNIYVYDLINAAKVKKWTTK